MSQAVRGFESHHLHHNLFGIWMLSVIYRRDSVFGEYKEVIVFLDENVLTKGYI